MSCLGGHNHFCGRTRVGHHQLVNLLGPGYPQLERRLQLRAFGPEFDFFFDSAAAVDAALAWVLAVPGTVAVETHVAVYTTDLVQMAALAAADKSAAAAVVQMACYSKLVVAENHYSELVELVVGN